jgi:thioester reductase-like protein
MSETETVFLTGFPGFIASRLLQRLLADDFNFVLLVQPVLLPLARAELSKIIEDTGCRADAFRIVEGDITYRDLGLSDEELALARTTTTHIFHLAAIYDLAVQRDLAFRVNVEGTKNVNRFAQSVERLRHYHYISTCYVAGKRKGRVLETDLSHGAGFRNHYEETKYLAEQEVEVLKSKLPVTIHRPAVVVGDSQTGETAKYDGIYYLIHYLLRSPRLLTRFNIGNDIVRLNLIPVDFVVDALTVLARDERVIGKTLQLADPAPPTTAEVFDEVAICLTGKGSTLKIPAPLVQFSLMLPPSPMLTGLPHNAVPYFFLKQTYDTTLSTTFLNTHEIVCPPFGSYVKNIVRFAAEHPKL